MSNTLFGKDSPRSTGPQMPASRIRDPQTSKRAAQQAQRFAGGHRERILHAMEGQGEIATDRIADRSGLTIVQVDRRMHELRKSGLVVLVSEEGQYSAYRLSHEHP